MLTISNNIKIKIQKTRSDNPWSKLDTKIAITAMERLSGDAFKLWVRLALNQDGFISTLDQEKYKYELSELSDTGYIIASDNAALLFTEDADNESVQENCPVQWVELYTLYYKTMKNSVQDLDYVMERLIVAGIEDKIDSVLAYWTANYSELVSTRPAGARNALRYDFAKVLTWYLWDHFTLELGDVLVVGRDGKRIRCHNDIVKSKIVEGAKLRHIESVEMQEHNITFWRKAFAQRKIELNHGDIKAILAARKQRTTK